MAKKLSDRELLAERKKRATKYPAPTWGDHALRGVARFTRAAFVLNKEALAKAMGE